jgi:hypothetical protein
LITGLDGCFDLPANIFHCNILFTFVCILATVRKSPNITAEVKNVKRKMVC